MELRKCKSDRVAVRMIRGGKKPKAAISVHVELFRREMQSHQGLWRAGYTKGGGSLSAVGQALWNVLEINFVQPFLVAQKTFPCWMCGGVNKWEVQDGAIVRSVTAAREGADRE